MNEAWFGDSYDIVKRFFVDVVKANGYSVYADPMFTGAWRSTEPFFKFLGVQDATDHAVPARSALFVDPDIGIGNRRSARHTTIAVIVEKLDRHDMVFVFDQAFSRALPSRGQLRRKLQQIEEFGAHGFYYDSHARFLFCSRSIDRLRSIRKAVLRTGLPERRVISLESATA
jgi:hypothetical protein